VVVKEVKEAVVLSIGEALLEVRLMLAVRGVDQLLLTE